MENIDNESTELDSILVGNQPTDTASNGTEGHSQTDSQPKPSPQIPGPDAAIAEFRKRAETAEKISKDPEVLKFIKEREEQKLAAEAEQKNINPEIYKEIQEIKANQEASAAQAKLEKAQISFREATSSAGMGVNEQRSYLEWASKTLHPSVQKAMYEEGFDHTLYIDAFARSLGVETKKTESKTPVFVPGHGNPASQTEQNKKAYNALIKEIVEN